MKDTFSELNDESLWLLYADSKEELRKRGLIRTSNITGERGEFLAIEIYNNTPGLPNLQAAPKGTRNVDALSRKGERYSIKTITEPGRTTGVFYGLGDQNSEIPNIKFEYVIIVQLWANLRPRLITELTFEQFLKHRRWHSTMRAWNLTLTKSLLKDARQIFIDTLS